MFSKMFNHVNLLQKSLDATWMRQEVIAQNIANADTPDYKSKHLEFESLFRQAIEDSGRPNTTKPKPGHIAINTSDPLEVNPVLVTENWHTMRMDGNNVDIDQEMVELSENTIQYNALVGQVNSELARLKLAVTGR